MDYGDIYADADRQGREMQRAGQQNHAADVLELAHLLNTTPELAEYLSQLERRIRELENRR